MKEVKKYARFYLQMRKEWADDKQKDVPIIMWFNYNGKKLNTTTGIKTTQQNWDVKKQRVKQNVARSNEVNRYLDLLEQKVNDIYFKALADDIIPTNDYIIERLKAPEKKTASFFDEWDKYLNAMAVRLSRFTMKSARSAYNHFKEFCKTKGLNNIKFEDITPNLKAEFAEFILKDKGDVNNTVHAVQKRMTTFLNYAEKIGLHTNHSHKQFNMPERVGAIKFLDWDEVKKLIDVKVEPGLESDARDLFVFCCMTALRFSDVLNLKKADIRKHTFKNLEGIHYAAHIRQQKTYKPTVIPLLPGAMDILEKYKNEKTEFALPQRANQTVNRIIKLVAKKAKLNELQEIVEYRGTERKITYEEKWKVLTTHVARRTFATIAITSGIPINTVASITGQNPKTLLIHYMGVIDSKRFEEIAGKLKF